MGRFGAAVTERHVDGLEHAILLKGGAAAWPIMQLISEQWLYDQPCPR